MDQFVKELTDTLSKLDEDVVLVMYGDHLPTMGLTVTDMKNKYLFQTEYVIWDNMGLEKKDKNLAAYQMAAEVLDRVGTVSYTHLDVYKRQADESAFTRKVDFFMELPKGEPELIELCVD